jgi:glycerol-3-phosphate O-acyltransferase
MSKLRPVVEAENRLERFNADRDRIVDEVERRVMATLLDRAIQGGEWALEYVLNDCAYRELKRLEDRKDRGAHKQQQRWRELAYDLARMSDADKQDRLRQLIRHYAGDIVGNFNPRVYRFANDLLPPALGLLFTPAAGWRKGLSALSELSGRIQVEGPVDLVRALTERGTLVVTPTHSSNMDSIAVGFGISRSGLPAMTYGAGKNLFTNPLISYFMHNLGAYRVDRRLRFGLYKQILKEYSTVLLESGYHSLFFPGGTRCRSNEVEQKLKLGLLGTAVTAFRNNVANGAAHRRIYVVPVTINYRLVLEAETLVDDYLAETGQSRYIITDDEFSRIGRVVEFMRKTMAHAGAVVLRFGQPRDPLGNPVNDLGDSIDRRGRIIDPATYMTGRDGSVTDDEQRDAEYTRMLGTALAGDYRRETVFMSTQLVARALYDAVAERHRTRDIYRLLRLTGADCAVSMADAVGRVDRLRQRIAREPAYGQLTDRVRKADAEAVVREAVASLGTYHTRPVAERRGDDIRIGYMKLLYYYQNRTSHIPEASS